MSIRVMTAVWDCEDLQDSEMLVFLAMADWSDDAGKCWPSIAQIANKTRKGERTVQGVIKSLAAKGHLTRDEKPGKGCTYYLHPRSGCAPNPRKDRTPAVSAPPQRTADTPAAAAPNTPVHTITSLVASQPSRARTPAVAADRYHRLPADWSPTKALSEKLQAKVADWPPGKIGDELEALRRWAANASNDKGKGRKLNWQIAWENWLDRADNDWRARNGNRTANNRSARPNRSSEIDDAARNLGFG